ncbi:MAG: hypothetical protein ACI32N_03490 [Bulleidia sp.]
MSKRISGSLLENNIMSMTPIDDLLAKLFWQDPECVKEAVRRVTGDDSITVSDLRTSVIYTFLSGPYIQCDVVFRSGRKSFDIELDTDPSRVSWSRSAFYSLFISVAESQAESKYVKTHYNKMIPVHNIVFTP